MSRYDPSVVQGTLLDRAEIDHQIEMYRTRDAAERLTVATGGGAELSRWRSAGARCGFRVAA